MAQVIECLPSEHEALSSNFSTVKTFGAKEPIQGAFFL
jgi:hypothetical protein